MTFPSPHPSPVPIPPYNLTTLTRLLTRHYTTLSSTGYMSPTCILHPPSSGWSNTRISASALRLTGRNATVITLLKHIPYLAPKLQIWSDETCPISYLDKNHDVEVMARELARGRKWGALCPFMPFDEETDVPGGMVCLTEGDGGSWWMVDTDVGVVYPFAWGEYWDYDVDESLLAASPWLRYKAIGIEAFFDRLQEGLLGLEVVSLPGFVRERKGGVKDTIEHEVCPAGYPEGKLLSTSFWSTDGRAWEVSEGRVC